MHLFALSIIHFFSSAGADAGFAALVGLAILVLLYFAHARETSALRDQLEAAMRRIEQLERAGGASSVGARQTGGGETPPPRPVTAPPPPPTGSQPPSATLAASAPPPVAPPPSVASAVSARRLSAPPVAAPAGLGAPPLSDATRVVPVAQPPGPGEAAASVPRERAAAAGDGLAATPAPMTGTTPAPVTAAAGGNGFSAAPVADEATGLSRSPLEQGLPRNVPRWLIPVAAVIIVAAIAVLLVLVLRPGSSHHKAAAAAHRHHSADIAAAQPGVTPSLVTVAVVNATGVNDLAHHVSTHLTAMHFQPGTLATATNQSHSTTTVAYLAGHHTDALAVAHALRLPAGAVRLAPQSTEGLVCPNPSDCTADVIVVAGSNLAPKR